MPEIKYTGYKDLVLTNEQFAEVYTSKIISDIEFVENENNLKL